MKMDDRELKLIKIAWLLGGVVLGLLIAIGTLGIDYWYVMGLL